MREAFSGHKMLSGCVQNHSFARDRDKDRDILLGLKILKSGARVVLGVICVGVFVVQSKFYYRLAAQSYHTRLADWWNFQRWIKCEIYPLPVTEYDNSDSAIKCTTKYFEHPTYVSTDLVNQWDAVFPAITVCPDGNVYHEEVLRQHGVQVGIAATVLYCH